MSLQVADANTPGVTAARAVQKTKRCRHKKPIDPVISQESSQLSAAVRPPQPRRSNPADHLTRHQFKPGQSGNPSGRPMDTVRRLLHRHDPHTAEQVVEFWHACVTRTGAELQRSDEFPAEFTCQVRLRESNELATSAQFDFLAADLSDISTIQPCVCGFPEVWREAFVGMVQRWANLNLSILFAPSAVSRWENGNPVFGEPAIPSAEHGTGGDSSM